MRRMANDEWAGWVAEVKPQGTHCDAPGVWHGCGCALWPRNPIRESSLSTQSHGV